MPWYRRKDKHNEGASESAAAVHSVRLTTDRNDPRLRRGEPENGEQNEVYLVLPEAERAKGFIRPLRRAYVHQYMLDGSPVPSVLLTRQGMGGCGTLTRMGLALCETWARDVAFYGKTWCICQ